MYLQVAGRESLLDSKWKLKAEAVLFTFYKNNSAIPNKCSLVFVILLL